MFNVTRRIHYKQIDNVDNNEIVNSIMARRGGKLLNLDLALLNSPAFARGWNALLHEVRNELGISPKLRELAICTVAVVNNAEYEWQQHAPEFLKAGGTQSQLDALKLIRHAVNNNNLFDEYERSVIQLSIEITKHITVSTTTFATIKSLFPSDKQIIELVGIIATYNMVSRFLIALGIELEKSTVESNG